MTEMEARLYSLEAFVRSHLSGGDVYVRRVYYTSGSIASTPDALPWQGLDGSDLTGSEADGDDTAAATGRAVVGGICTRLPGETVPRSINEGTYREYGVVLRPDSGTYEGERIYRTDRYDIYPPGLAIVLRGRLLNPVTQLGYDSDTGNITFEVAPFASGAIVPDVPSNVLFCLFAERYHSRRA